MTRTSFYDPRTWLSRRYNAVLPLYHTEETLFFPAYQYISVRVCVVFFLFRRAELEQTGIFASARRILQERRYYGDNVRA